MLDADSLTRTGQSTREVRVIVPASTANLGPGFDSLGMALPIFAGVSMKAAEQTRVCVYGEGLQGLPLDKTNLVYGVAQKVFDKVGMRIPELEIALESDIPLARGLGSSAAAIVGSLVAANELIGGALTTDELFQMAVAMENHPDNVGAALFGGFVAAAWDGNRAEAVRLEPPADLEVLVAIPLYELPTKQARGVLPKQVPMEDAVFNVSHSSLLTAALAAGRLDVLRHAMRDKLHQPYRASMIPGMEEVLRNAPDHGALGAVLSGAGPTLLMLAHAGDPQRAELESYVKQTMKAAGVEVETRWVKPCPHGVQVTVTETSGPPQPPLTAVRKEQPGVSV
jgi:homoserine kinase